MQQKIVISIIALLCSIILSTNSLTAQPKVLPSAESIIDNWIMALGGRQRIERIKNIYQYGGTFEGGLKGRIEEWSTAEGQHRRVYERIGVDSSVTVYDGRQGWYRDWNGKVRDLQGADLQNEVAEAYQSSYSVLIPRRMPGKAEFLGSDETGKLYILKFSPLGGRAITYFLDKSTFLPMKSERLNEEGILLTTRFSDWHDVEGVKVPFGLRRGTGDAKYDTAMNIKKVAFNLVTTVGEFVRPLESAFDTRFAQGNSSLGIPFKRINNFILVQGRINDSMPMWFVLDTGASITVINKDRAVQLGLPLSGDLEIGTSGASTGFSIVRDVSFALPGAEVVNQRAGAISLGIFEAGLGLPMGGVLGFDFISRFIVEIDFDAQTINLHNPATYKYKGNGKIVSFTLEGGRPFIRAAIGISGKRFVTGTFEIDTGDTKSIYLNTPFVRENGLASASPQVGSTGTSTNYMNSLSVNGRVDKLIFGPFLFNDVPAGFSLGESGFVASSDYAGLLGNAILNRFRVIFDYSNRRMILEPNSHLHEPFIAVRSFGALVIAQGPELKTFMIARVTKNSPAEKAGLRSGDIITAIDAAPSAALTLEQVQLFLSQEGQKHLVTIRRGNEVLKLPLEIKLTTGSQ